MHVHVYEYSFLVSVYGCCYVSYIVSFQLFGCIN